MKRLEYSIGDRYGNRVIIDTAWHWVGKLVKNISMILKGGK